jgi:hypothetical protein
MTTIRVKKCPNCKGQMGAIEEDGETVLKCGEYFGLDQAFTNEALREYESNGYPEPCGYQEVLAADIEAHIQQRPRLFS